MKWILLVSLVFSQWAGSEDKKPVWKTGKSKIKIQPEYESCKEVDLSSLDLKEISSSNDTTAEFCLSCSIKEVLGFGELKETAQAIQSKTFMDKLRKRVIGQIESKIFQTKMLHACATGNRNWLSRQKVDWPLMKALCKQKNKQFKSSIKTRWTEMRVNLALSQVNPDQIVTGKPYLSFPLSHAISDFSSMPKLTKKEQKVVKKRWGDRLAKTPLDKLTPSEFKAHFLKGEPSKLTTRDRRQLRKSTWKMQKEAKDTYFEIASEMPLLGYLKTGNPNKKELGEAFTKMEENLKDLLKEAKDSEGDEGLLLSFKPLVEELLKENENYCLVAEKARIKAERDESLKNWMMLGAGVVAAVPCFITGPVGASVCLTAGMALGVVGYKEAQSATKKSLGRALTGKQFETMAELDEKEKEEFLAKLFLPLGAWGTTAVPARAASGAVAKAVKGARAGKGSKKRDLAERKRLGEKSLGKSLSKKQVESLERAHRVGLGQKGKDGAPARIGNYTEAQLREKSRILRQAGFSSAERKKLIKDGVVGLNLRSLTKEQTQELIDVTDLTPEQVLNLHWDYLTPKQTQDLNLKSLLAKAEEDSSHRKRLLSELQIKDLSDNQIKDLPIEELSLDQVRDIAGRLDEIQIKKIPNQMIAGHIPDLPLEHLTPEQTQALGSEYFYKEGTGFSRDYYKRNIQRLNVEDLSKRQISAYEGILRFLTPEQTQKLVLKNMNYEIFLMNVNTRDLSQRQVEQLEIEVIMKHLYNLEHKARKNGSAFEKTIAERRASSIQQFNVEYLTPEQIDQLDAKYLSKDQVKALMRRELRENNPELVEFREGLEKISSGSSKEEVQTVYRKMAQKYHPDKASDDPQATKRFQQIQETYQKALQDLGIAK